ncbi:MAG TPA: cytochrome d ubiquinol oxidase subunit II [Streptosporangiaceae bacterium]|jgi:cytochrome d ubiquinol oxidase subunit II
MSYADVAVALILVGLSAYLLFGGADFGAGLWHLLARRAAEKDVIEHAMGPVWEANHVWLIFVMVMTWTAFPPVFAGIMTAYWVPLSLAALGIVIRGSAFAFMKIEHGFKIEHRRRYRWAFGVSSVVTPYALGAVAGTIAAGDRHWLSPPGAYAGLLTVGLCAYLAAVYLTWDARRLSPNAATAERFRSYALGTGAVVGALALPGSIVLGVRSPLIGLSALAGLVSLVLLWRRAYLAVRLSAALAAGSVLWGAAVLSDLDLDAAAAHDAVLRVIFVALGVGGIFLLPALAWLYVLFQREAGSHEDRARAR